MSVYAEKRNGRLTGRWIGEVEIAGKRHRERFATETEAKAWELRLKAPVAPAIMAPTNVIDLYRVPTQVQRSQSLRDFYLEVRSVLWGGAKTRDEVYRLTEDCIDALGNPPVTSITKKELNALVSKWQAEGKSAKRINNLLVPLGRLLREAEDHFQGWNAPKLPKLDGADRKRSRVVSHEEEAQLLKLLKGYGREDIADLCELLIITGCRVGELLQAVPSQLRADKLGSYLQLTDAQVKNGQGRKVRLAGRALEIAKARLPFQLAYDVVNYWFNKARSEMGIEDPDFCIHALRHTCGTRLLNEEKIDIRVVQEYLGHKSIVMTQRYVEVEGDALAEAAKALGRVRS